MTDDQLRELANCDTRPEGVDVYSWWMAPFLIDITSELKPPSVNREEIQLDFFDGNESPLNKG